MEFYSTYEALSAYSIFLTVSVAISCITYFFMKVVLANGD